ncbi:MAG: FAD-dependent oxidoreductase, partial [Bacteroidales bacterium]|nr:FAD-dependent oxidoreductase [Bacteroidales bacterium]
MRKQDNILLLASRFADKGGWTVEQQFIHQMGSSYLLAHGIGVAPVADAKTSFHVETEGEYTLFVRTKNWTKYWSDGPTPGIFQVLVDGIADGETFGTGLSASTGNVSTEWIWQKGGTVRLSEGVHEIALHDLTGFDGRADAIYLTRSGDIPGDSLEVYKSMREAFLGEETIEDKGDFDFVVVGGGIAGECAAISAARLGLKVALIQDRYVLGGNNSSEIRVGLGGRINLPPYGSLGYIVNEIGPERGGNARGAHNYEDDRKMRVLLEEKNITLFLGYSVVSCEKEGKAIKAVNAMEVTEQKLIRVSGKMFSDCTGDASLAVMAGAETLSGRESRSSFGESLAPETADDLHMGGSIEWYCEDHNVPCSYPDSLDWGLELDETTIEPVHRANWYWECGMHYDPIGEAEKMRDYGMYVAYSTFSYCKNRYSAKEDWECTHLIWVSHVIGKRESRRIVGDHILTQNDILRKIPYEDASASVSWNIDQHFPRKDNAAVYPGDEWLSEGHLTPVTPYGIPYRCFYSKDLSNLFMAGRDISVTHVALGSTRVMRTCGMIGEVVGMAASICVAEGTTPRGVYENHLEELKQLMRKG